MRHDGLNMMNEQNDNLSEDPSFSIWIAETLCPALALPAHLYQLPQHTRAALWVERLCFGRIDPWLLLFIHPLVLQSSCSLYALLPCILSAGLFGCNIPGAPLGSSPRSQQVVTELDNMDAHVPQEPMLHFCGAGLFWGAVGGASFSPAFLMDRGEDGRYLCRMHVKSGTKRGLFSWQPH